MKKKIFRLNESQLRGIVSESIKKVLMEYGETENTIVDNDVELMDYVDDIEPDQEALDMAPKMPYHFRKKERFDDDMVNNFNVNDYLGQI